MFFLIWGVGTDFVHLKSIDERDCPSCRKWRRFSYWLRYEYLHIFWFLGAVVYRRYLIACDHCLKGHLVPKSELPTLDAKGNQIPFLKRWGIYLCLVMIVIGLVITLKVLEDDYQAKLQEQNSKQVEPTPKDTSK